MAYTAIDDPEAYFQTVIYTGNGSANNAITLPGDTDMQPDVVWIKNRDATDSHCWFDSVRGATKVMHVDGDGAETTDADTLDSFASDGFQVDADVKVNTNAEKYVAWCWKESATSGFDMVSFEGNATNRTVSHSLSAVPHLMIFKNVDATGDWLTYHHGMATTIGSGQVVKGDPETDYLYFNLANAVADSALHFNDTAPTSSVFTVGTGGYTNADGNTIMAYVFTEKQGFSKFGTYQGNVDVDGKFIHMGFKPAMFIFKETGNAENWACYDNKRSDSGGPNPNDQYISTNITNAEASGVAIDFVSNGVKLRANNGHINEGSYIYIAFAETPFVNSNGVPGNAV
jgi:hypothetical protein